MATFNFNDRRFKAVSTDGNGDVTSGTEFHYRQMESTISATYKGGGIIFGMLIAVVREDGTLDARYQHVNEEGRLMTGVCSTTPELLPDGRLRLHETWRWTCGDGSEGRSVVEEIS